MEVIYIRIEPQEKMSLKIEAEKLGTPLTTYCRMILIKSLKEWNVKKYQVIYADPQREVNYE